MSNQQPQPNQHQPNQPSPNKRAVALLAALAVGGGSWIQTGDPALAIEAAGFVLLCLGYDGPG